MTQWKKVSGTADKMWQQKGEQLKVGASVSGRYIAKQEGVGDNKSNVYTLEQDDGTTIGVWGSTVIDGKFEYINIGKMVKIEYIGVKTNKKGKNYNAFDIFEGIDYADTPLQTTYPTKEERSFDPFDDIPKVNIEE